MSDHFDDIIHSTFWAETPQADNPYSADLCRCRGYDVYGDMLGQASYFDYLHLLIKGERAAPQRLRALELLALALANPGPRDASVHAAMAAAVGGSPAAAALTAALASGAGSYGGAREVLLAMQVWEECGTSLPAWTERLAHAPAPVRATVWPEADHPPGFAPYGTTCALPVLQTLDQLAAALPGGRLAWLRSHRSALEQAAGCPLALTGVAAAAFADLDCSPAEGEMLTLLMRLPGAAAHALEQTRVGYRRFPFFALDVVNDPQRTAKEQQ